MSILYEYFNTGWIGGYGSAAEDVWLGMTFTPSILHRITKLKLLLWRVGLPGTATVSIRATDGEGKPTGGDLCFGTTDADTLPIYPPEWRTITLGGGYFLSAGTKYAIAVRVDNGLEGVRELYWAAVEYGGYPGGNSFDSFDAGLTWNFDGNWDFMFEDWGDPVEFADAASRFKLAEQAYKDVAARFTLPNYQDVSTRFLLYQPSWKSLQILEDIAELEATVAGLELGPRAHFEI